MGRGLSWLPLGVDVKYLLIDRLLRSQEMAHESGAGVEGEDGAELTIYKVAYQAV